MSSSSKPTLASLQTQLTEQQALITELVARLDALSIAAPAAPAKGAKKEKKPRDPDAPKRPLSSYLVFCAAERAKTPDEKLKVADLSERWSKLDQAAKDAFKPAAE